MKITVLGSGTSTGVPELRCNCRVCRSKDKHDKRLRASVIVEDNNQSVLIDCGPDFRTQLLNNPILNPTSLIITHTHYDHIGGLDDIRPFTREKAMNIYAEDFAANHIKENYSYMFAEHRYPGIADVVLNVIDTKPFNIDSVLVQPIRLMHHKLPVLGFRIKDFAYLTDLSYISDSEIEKLKGLKVLFLGVIRHRPHISHLHLAKAIEIAQKIGAENTYFTHLCHHIGLHNAINETLPENMQLASDGMTIVI